MISQVGSGCDTNHIEYSVYIQIMFVGWDFLSLFDKGTRFDHQNMNHSKQNMWSLLI